MTQDHGLQQKEICLMERVQKIPKITKTAK